MPAQPPTTFILVDAYKGNPVVTRDPVDGKRYIDCRCLELGAEIVAYELFGTGWREHVDVIEVYECDLLEWRAGRMAIGQLAAFSRN